MNKTELIDAVAASTGKPKTEVKLILDALVEEVVKTVKNGDEVSLIGFGTFKSSFRKGRDGRHPTTGEVIHIADSNVPKFVPGKQFKDAVNAK